MITGAALLPEMLNSLNPKEWPLQAQLMASPLTPGSQYLAPFQLLTNALSPPTLGLCLISLLPQDINNLEKKSGNIYQLNLKTGLMQKKRRRRYEKQRGGYPEAPETGRPTVPVTKTCRYDLKTEL